MHHDLDSRISTHINAIAHHFERPPDCSILHQPLEGTFVELREYGQAPNPAAHRRFAEDHSNAPDFDHLITHVGDSDHDAPYHIEQLRSLWDTGSCTPECTCPEYPSFG